MYITEHSTFEEAPSHFPHHCRESFLWVFFIVLNLLLLLPFRSFLFA